MIQCYVATRMTGRDKREQIKRAKYVCAILRQYGIEPISPVLEENVPNIPGPLINDNETRLAGYWARDKHIIRRLAHVILVDGAHEKSIGVEREYGLARWNLWKPVVLLMPNIGLTVSKWEDDYVTDDVHKAGELIRERWGTFEKRFVWRIRMLAKCLPAWILNQLYAFR